MLKIKVSIHIVLTCAALLYASIVSAECCPPQTKEKTLPICKPAPSAPCFVVGGNSEFCSNEPENRLEVGEWLPEYQCYAEYGICERDDKGQCGWRNTDELSQCLANMRTQESIIPCTPYAPVLKSGCQ